MFPILGEPKVVKLAAAPWLEINLLPTKVLIAPPKLWPVNVTASIPSYVWYFFVKIYKANFMGSNISYESL